MTCITRDTWIETPRGRLFARTWTPPRRSDALGPVDAPPGGRAPIVLFHDSLGCVELWRRVPERLCLETGRTVVAYDRLGFGKSDRRPDRLAHTFIREEAEDWFPRVRDALGLDEFVAAGHSVGGVMAAHCAAALPAACRALVTESAQAFVEDRTLQGLREARRSFQEPGMLERLERYHGGKARWVLDAWLETWLDPDFGDWTIAPALQAVSCPALVIHGDRDEYGSVEHPRRIAGAIASGARTEILPGCGHVPHREREPAFISLVAGFLAGTPAPTGG